MSINEESKNSQDQQKDAGYDDRMGNAQEEAKDLLAKLKRQQQEAEEKAKQQEKEGVKKDENEGAKKGADEEDHQRGGGGRG